MYFGYIVKILKQFVKIMQNEYEKLKYDGTVTNRCSASIP